MGDVDELVARAAEPTRESIRKLEEKSSPPLRPLLAAIRAHLLEPGFNVERLTRETGASKWVLSGFTAEIGITPWQFICEARMEVAGRLLRDTDLSVDEIAYRLGHSSLSVFQRGFKRCFEMSPSRYRDRSRRALGELAERFLSWRWWHGYERRGPSAADIQTLTAHVDSLYGLTGRGG